MKRVAILGSTGSIGTQTLDIIRHNGDKLKVVSLVAFSDDVKLQRQAAEFYPEYCALISKQGADCLIEAVKRCDIAVVATRGITALECIIYCLQNGIDVALANKEALVCGGGLIMPLAVKANLYPIDSEHCAIKQCLSVHSGQNVSEILLTASGGPFWNTDISSIGTAPVKQALKHPNWNMGSKITVDSATMMNKSLEVIEASRLFGVPVNNISIVVHRQSVVHSMVEFTDGSVIAQLAIPDMRLPIQCALLGDDGNWQAPSIDWASSLSLTFEPCNFDKFPCAKLAYEMQNYPVLCTTVMNAANDICVDRYLQEKLSFGQIYNIIITTVNHFAEQAARDDFTVQNIGLYDKRAKEYAARLADGVIC